MNRKMLWVVAAIAGATAITLAFWAQNIYASTERVRGFVYAMRGYSAPIAERMASADASVAINTHVVIAWVLCGVALVFALGAILRKDQQVG